MPPKDTYPFEFSQDVTQSASNAQAVTPSDSADLPFMTRGLYVGGEGNVSVVMRGGQTASFVAGTGAILPIRVARVRATGTSATDIVALW